MFVKCHAISIFFTAGLVVAPYTSDVRLLVATSLVVNYQSRRQWCYVTTITYGVESGNDTDVVLHMSTFLLATG
jgi:hypothetical protein